MNEYRKLNAYYVEADDGRHLVQVAGNKEDARVNALLTLGLRTKLVILRRATDDDVAQARKQAVPA